MNKDNFKFDNGALWHESRKPVDEPLTKRERFAIADFNEWELGIAVNKIIEERNEGLDFMKANKDVAVSDLAKARVMLTDALLKELEATDET